MSTGNGEPAGHMVVIEANVLPDHMQFLVKQQMSGEWDSFIPLSDSSALVRTNMDGWLGRLYPYLVGVTMVFVKYEKGRAI